MQTPNGRECRYFYGNYYRGRSHEECRLLQSASPPQPWGPKLCLTCPVPEILLANSCQHMVLHGKVSRSFLWMHKQVQISAYCTKTSQPVDQPHIGCGQCHPSLLFLEDTQGETDAAN